VCTLYDIYNKINKYNIISRRTKQYAKRFIRPSSLISSRSPTSDYLSRNSKQFQS